MAAAGDEDERKFRWEGEYEKTWEAIREDDDGMLELSVEESLRRAKRQRKLHNAVIRLGVMRHLYIVLDLSEAMLDQDMKPTRQICAIKLLQKFVEEFFDQNPISQLGLVTMRNKRAEKLSELGGNSKVHRDALIKALDITCLDEPSLVNALELTSQTLKNMPTHASREILIILGSLTSCDPADIRSTIKFIKSNSIRCSVIGLSAELHICKLLSKETGGSYGVALDDNHFQELLLEHVAPPPAVNASASSLIRMGFPHSRIGKPSVCLCHSDSEVTNSNNMSNGSKMNAITSKGFYCPQCLSKYCELPVECKSCGLTLISAPHLARSYHYFFRLDVFEDVPTKATNTESHSVCQGCQQQVTDQTMYKCQKCNWYFCFDCDVFLHETLHSCPGCSSSPHVLKQEFGVN